MEGEPDEHVCINCCARAAEELVISKQLLVHIKRTYRTFSQLSEAEAEEVKILFDAYTNRCQEILDSK